MLNTVNRVSITTDMWTSVQNIHYMVVTCHFVDSDFDIHKCILSFVDVPPPYSGVHMYDCLFKCLKDWNIEMKVATLTVDNAKTNDMVARKLMDNLNLQKNFLLMENGLSEIQDIIHNVRESVKHVGASPGRLHLFSELTKQLQLKKKHLILDVSTRWNATYAMLSTALEFKEVFENYAGRESTYTKLPSGDDWKKCKDVCSFLSLFDEATKIISGSEYPTSNLFLIELYVIKNALDTVALEENDCMRSMACKMKEKFDKYWGSTNLLISLGAVMDPRYKMELIKLSFNTIYSLEEAKEEVQVVNDILEDLFNERHIRNRMLFELVVQLLGVEARSELSELATYLEEGVYICETGASFDVLGWWKENRLKYRILSKMAADILSIPITTVASESAFNAGGRVVEPHRSCLGTEMVDMLVCGAD
ncbi:zinc finger BED domain-containing protein RICESLEEPER 2-like [Helianthus annuus]|uniref:zinc finger BED domain-containing protein RICESLEEPER 2-like n=1 Tax=Helianthus annuus TaxID=4232 RepID=UPI000B8FC983|nr:zinc finger BED domain-containing protein RICESLEEPER 2-like [Helianthus annuus]